MQGEPSTSSGLIRRPRSQDFEERAAIRALRESGELVHDSTAVAASASGKLVRALVALVALPTFVLPAAIAANATTIPWQKLAWTCLVVLVLAAVAWTWGFKGEWRGRLRDRSDRLATLEDTSTLRQQALRAPVRDGSRP